MRIKDLREESKLTQREVSDHLHIRQNTYSQYESGKRQIPLNFLIMLAELYKTSTDYILELTNEREPYKR